MTTVSANTGSTLFDAHFLSQLDRLTLISKRIRAGAMKGERRSPRRGTSIQFADYRNYTPGDDLRQIDWNIYGRLEKLFLKLFEEEEDLTVHLVLDASGSMDWAFPLAKGENPDRKFSQNKLNYARRVAAAIAYIGLTNYDRVGLTVLHGEGKPSRFPLARGKRQVWPLLHFLEAVPAGGAVDLDQALNTWARQTKQPGLFFLLSDLMSAGTSGPIEGLKAVQQAGFEINIMHILAPDEIQPTIAGDLKLIDIENGVSQDVTVDGHMLADYQQRLVAWRTSLESFAQRRKMNYLPIITSDPLEDMMLFYLRRKGILS